MTEFKKEDRYIVLKRKDLAGVPIHLKKELRSLMERMSKFIPEREYVVVESDWPEYEKVWDMIEARMPQNEEVVRTLPHPAAVEAIEVVGWRVEFPLNNGAKVYDQRQEWAYQEYGDVSYHVDELMTVDQHHRILAAQRTKTCIALKERNDAKAVAQHKRILAAATHPADQVEDDLAMVKVSRKVLEQIAGALLSAPILDGVTLKTIMHQQDKLRVVLRALLDKP